MRRILAAIGTRVTTLLVELGRFTTIFWRVLVWTVRPPYDVAELLRQIVL